MKEREKKKKRHTERKVYKNLFGTINAYASKNMMMDSQERPHEKV